ncbi:hypothetical protein [Thauera sp. SDU_THAU2]|uniref:hypothetical protein n=1 Tax=Thauera sp. SDU_THAU2 TaxID=3136633 RepID=UPI00311DC5BB
MLYRIHASHFDAMQHIQIISSSSVRENALACSERARSADMHAFLYGLNEAVAT